MLEPLTYESEIIIDNVPIQWLPLIQLFDPNLQQYPKVHVHAIYKNDRIYGFPVHINLVDEKDGLCRINVIFLSNKDLTKNDELKAFVKDELENRFGIKDKVDLGDIIDACNGDRGYERFFTKLWNEFVSKAYGKSLPFGRLYEGMDSILRFTAALTPMSGGKSENQMFYDFMRHYGTKVDIMQKWSHLEFYIIPTYQEMINGKLDKIFDNYILLLNSIRKFEGLFFRNTIKINKLNLKTFSENMSKVMGFDIRNGNGFRKLTSHLLSSGKIQSIDKENLDFLIDAFNRMPLRAISYMGSIININKNNDLSLWSKDDFVKLYTLGNDAKGIHPKIWGCYLQQGFGNQEVIPIDLWIEAFYENVLDIHDKETFLSKFKKMGKMERLIWLASQARKTNMSLIFDSLWCIKFGMGKSTEGDWGDKKELRGPNPLSCLDCKLKGECLSYKSIENEDVIIFNGDPHKVPRILGCKYAVYTDSKIPKLVFLASKDGWMLIDAFSGYELHRITNLVGKKVKVKELIEDLNR